METWDNVDGKDLENELAAVMLSNGATKLVQTSPGRSSTISQGNRPGPREWRPELYVMEGTCTTRLEFWHWPSWLAVEKCMSSTTVKSALANATEQNRFGRIIAFSNQLASRV